jgi:predicted enzyme involved in methoxymalonyl-ACP biosynthesis
MLSQNRKIRLNMATLSISVARTSEMEEPNPSIITQIVNRLKEIHAETKKRNPKGYMDEMDMRLEVHMMDIAEEKGWSVIALEDKHFVFNLTQYADEDVVKVMEEKGSDSLTIDLSGTFD